MPRLTFPQLCRACGKSPVYVRNLQAGLGLPRPAGQERYSSAYAGFLGTVVALRAFGVPLDAIEELLASELAVLRLLKADALDASATWYLDQRDCKGHAERRLLLTGYDLGFPIGGQVIQPNLDFGARDPELFSGREMGEDVLLALDRYLQRLRTVTDRVRRERPVLARALRWARRLLG